MVLETFGLLLSFLGGAGGSWINKILGVWEKGKDYEHELELASHKARHELEVAKLGQTGQMAEREAIREIEAMKADMESLKASYEHDSSLSIGLRDHLAAMWAEIYKTLVRPTTTHLMYVLVLIIYITAPEAYQEMVIKAVLVSFAVIIGWWFGDRSQKVANTAFGPGFIKRNRGVTGGVTNESARSAGGNAALDGLRDAE